MTTLAKWTIMAAVGTAAALCLFVICGDDLTGRMNEATFVGLKAAAFAGLWCCAKFGRMAYRRGWLPDMSIGEDADI